MKLGSIAGATPDGQLVVVSKDGKFALAVPDICQTLQLAIESWNTISPKLQIVYQNLSGQTPFAFAVDESKFLSPLPRAYQWLDGSAFLQHVKLVRKARGAVIPPRLFEVPLMYQGVSDKFLSPYENIPFIDPAHGMDFEGEVAVIVSKVPMGTQEKDAFSHIKLIMLVNDVSLRGLIPDELEMGFGFLQSKPPSAHSPFAITPDELGPAWKDGRVHLPLKSEYNNKWVGNPNAGEMHFSFGKLIEHAAKTRELQSGTIIGSGTVSNEDQNCGQSCLAELRMLEKINTGEFKTPFMKPGDTIKISMKNLDGENLFGNIFQKVTKD
mgnify:CR=1 FL=1